MQRRLVLLAAAVLLAGCSQPSADPAATPAPVRAPPEVPAPVAVEATMPASVKSPASGDYPGVVDTTSPACAWTTAVCHRYAFSLDGPTDITALLAWDAPEADLDLSIVNGGASGHGLAFGAGSGSEESLSAHLDRGTYDLVVLGALSAGTPYSLAAEFESTA